MSEYAGEIFGDENQQPILEQVAPTEVVHHSKSIGEAALNFEAITSVAELARADLGDKRIIAANTLLSNRESVQKKHKLEQITWTPPSPDKYPDWFKWDEAFACQMFFETAEYCWQRAHFYESQLPQTPVENQQEVLSLIDEFRRRGDLYFRAGQEGISTSFAGMDETGFMSNSRILTKSGIKQAGLERRIIRKAGHTGSVYTQPILEPKAILTGYKAALANDPNSPIAQALLEEFYEPLKLHTNYFDKHGSDGEDSRLVGIPHPNASGRDSDHVFDHAKERLPRKGPDTGRVTNLRNAKRDYEYALNRTKEIVEAKGDMQKIREKFWDRDVMFNCIYLESLYHMAELAGYAGKQEDQQEFLDLAEQLEAEIQTMWNPDAWKGNGAFLNLDKDFNQIKEVSVGSLFGFTLRSLTAEQLESMLDLFETSFNTPYGVPSIPTDSPNFDPNYDEIGRIWRGTSWDNVNDLIVEGLCMQAERDDMPMDLRQRCVAIANKVAVSSNKALDAYYPPSEFRNPLNGKPLRTRVNSFAWALLPRYMIKRVERVSLVTSQDEQLVTSA